ncbi:MAG TPA: RteC domain-containing protein [Ohtaekwangia sp.]|nr:RteC domain-containing protein [Ohtaekwangia sp.]
MEKELAELQQDSDSIIQESERNIDAILRSIDALKNHLLSHPFESIAEEVLFFKQIKPKFTSKLIYKIELLKIESRRPIGSFKAQQKYLLKQLAKLESFFEDNIEFYQYYRSGNTFLDDKYFVRNVFDIRLHQDTYVFDYDSNFSTSHDSKVARIIANELLRNYLNASLAELEQNKYAVSKFQEGPKKKLLWTAPKAALIELLYGLHSAGVFNDSNAEIGQIARYLQTAFGVDLGNYYRTFQEIRIRKSGRTNFIDLLKKKLVERMNDSDQNA